MKFLIMFSFILQPSLYAETLVISDVDDTIKTTNVHDELFLRKAFRASSKVNRFIGMRYLYSKLKVEARAKVFYVTNTTKTQNKLLLNSYRKFIKISEFPSDGIFFAKNKQDRKVHKTKTITTLIKKHQPATVILIGDNSEHDPAFYNDIQTAHPNIKFISFIRIIFSSPEKSAPLHDQQIGFVTPVEIATKLYTSNIFPKKSVIEVITDYLTHKEVEQDKKNTMHNKPERFPLYSNCSAFTWDKKISKTIYKITDKVEELKSIIKKNCVP